MKCKENNIYDHLYKDTTYGDINASFGYKLTDLALNTIKFKTVLDVGCGSGYAVLRFLIAGKTVKGIETSKYLVNERLKQLTDLQITGYGSILDIPFNNDTFDLVYCTEVLEHLEEKDIENALSQLVRVSNKYIFCTVSFVPSEFAEDLHLTVKDSEWWDTQFDKFRIKSIKKNLAKTGGIYVFKKY